MEADTYNESEAVSGGTLTNRNDLILRLVSVSAQALYRVGDRDGDHDGDR